jgi:hypothetical protein
VLERFTRTLPADQSRYVDMLYRQIKQVDEAVAELRHFQQLGQPESGRRIIAEQGPLLRQYPIVTQA